ncbi:MAG: DUF3822 family protein [Bacteroidia bacterium]
MDRVPYEQITHIPLEISEAMVPTCQLVIFLNPARIYYLLIAPSGEVVLCREYVNTERFSLEMFLRFVLEKDKLLSSPFLSCQICFSTPLFLLCPQAYWNDRHKSFMAKLALSDQLEEKEVAYSESRSLDVNIIFALKEGITHPLNRYVRYYTVSHVGLLMAEAAVAASRQQAIISVLIMSDHVLICAANRGQLKLCNSYVHRSDSDIVYFIQTVREATGLTDRSIPVTVMGELGSRIVREGGIWEFLPEVNIPDSASPFFVSQIAGTPWWKYAFLTLTKTGL